MCSAFSLKVIACRSFFSIWLEITNLILKLILYSCCNCIIADDKKFLGSIPLTEEQLHIAEMGKPRLGKFRRCQITIKESEEFQVTVISDYCRYMVGAMRMFLILNLV